MASKRRQRWLTDRYNADNRCHYCRTRTYRFDGPFMATVDHRVPRANKGWNHPTNYVLACYTCNQEKAATPYEEFKNAIRQRGEVAPRLLALESV